MVSKSLLPRLIKTLSNIHDYFLKKAKNVHTTFATSSITELELWLHKNSSGEMPLWSDSPDSVSHNYLLGLRTVPVARNRRAPAWTTRSDGSLGSHTQAWAPGHVASTSDSGSADTLPRWAELKNGCHYWQELEMSPRGWEDRAGHLWNQKDLFSVCCTLPDGVWVGHTLFLA